MIAQRLLVTAFLLLQAGLVWLSSGPLLLPAIAAALACLAFFFPRGLPLRGWLWYAVLLVVSALVLWKCAQQPYSEELTSWVVPAAVTLGLAEYLLVLQAVLAFHRRADGGYPAALPVLGVVAATGIFNRTVSFEQHPLYLAMALAVTVLAALLFQRSTETRVVVGRQHTRQRRVLVALVVGLAVLLGWQVSRQMSEHVGLLRPWTYDFGLSNRRRTTGGEYVRDATLHSVTVAKYDRPNLVALRVYAPRSPGYLRGKAFETYDASQWHNELGTKRDPTRGVERLDSSTNRITEALGLPRTSDGQRAFAIESRGSGPWTGLRIVNDPRRGKVFFTPLGTCYLQGSGRNLSIDAHHIVRGGISTNRPYTAFLPKERVPVSLSPRERVHLLARPAGLDPRVERIAEQVCRGKSSTRAKITAVEQFFQENFRYALGQLRVPEKEEPLSYFLLNRPPAHCEFFASGAIALLRMQGVPCRYVTGYVVEEQDEYGDYWLARNRHAHAWVEAYDEELERWVIVEPTPGMSAPSDEDDGIAELADAAAAGDGAVALSTNMFDRAWSVQSLAAVSLFVVALGTVGGFLTVRPDMRDRVLGRLGGFDPWLLTMHRHLRMMDRRARRRRFIRKPDETLHQFAQRMREQAAAKHRPADATREEAGTDPWLRKAADWYVQYAAVRYRAAADRNAPRPPPPALP